MKRALPALLLAAACGTGTDGTPVAPPTRPLPAPVPAPEPRVCTDERQRALNSANNKATLPREWDGTPFLVDLFDHFPEVEGVADYPADQLDVVRELADQIEEQIGYPIIEAGNPIPVPEHLPEGWNAPSPRVRFATCREWREPGHVLGIHLSALPDGNGGGGALSANSICGTLQYWVGDGVPPPRTARRPEWFRSAVVHEIFHLLGFKHYDDEYPEHVGVTMSPELLNGDRDGKDVGYMYATFEDLDALRCIFPEGGR